MPAVQAAPATRTQPKKTSRRAPAKGKAPAFPRPIPLAAYVAALRSVSIAERLPAGNWPTPQFDPATREVYVYPVGGDRDARHVVLTLPAGLDVCDLEPCLDDLGGAWEQSYVGTVQQVAELRAAARAALEAVLAVERIIGVN